MTTFTLDAFQNEYLPNGATTVSAIVTVTADGAGGAASPPSGDAAEIIIVDTSGSMEEPATKIRAARAATVAAIDEIRDGVWFAVISGDNEAHLTYPARGMVQASAQTRAAAIERAKHLDAGGGTAISTWLRLAYDLFSSQPASVRHAILLTDGRNESEEPELLDSMIESCVGLFQCDCRGVGANWEVSELRKISSALLGTVDIIPTAAEMEDAFREMMGSAMSKGVGSVALRVWVPQGAKLDFVRQVAPTIEDLTDKGTVVNPMTTDFPLGAWGAESRDYHIQISVKAGAVGAEMLAARTTLMVGDENAGQAMVKAIWTEDEALSTRINPQVAHYTGQAELAAVIQEGLEARKAGDDHTATLKLGRAVQLAQQSGNDGTIRLLKKVVDVEDAETGTVRLKKQVEDVDEMALDTRSTKTVRVGGKK